MCLLLCHVLNIKRLVLRLNAGSPGVFFITVARRIDTALDKQLV